MDYCLATAPYPNQVMAFSGALALQAVLAGADGIQMVSALLRHGPAYLTTMRRGLEQWLEWNKVSSLGEVRGKLSLQTTGDPAAFERAHYIKSLHTWSR